MKHRKPWSNCVCGPSIVLLSKLVIYCDYIWYILHTMDFYTRATTSLFWLKPTVSDRVFKQYVNPCAGICLVEFFYTNFPKFAKLHNEKLLRFDFCRAWELCWEYDTLMPRVSYSHLQSSVLPINNFGQQHLNGAANWSAAEGGRVLPHFENIVSGALTPPCPITAVFQFPCGRLVVGWSSVGQQ